MKVEVSFSCLHRNGRNSVTKIGKDSTKSGKIECHKLFPEDELQKTGSYPEYHSWSYRPQFVGKSEYLYGPASLKTSKALIYPCEKNKCFICCPCNQCLRKDTVSFSINECFEDHKLYHQALHLNCEFCSQLFKIFPVFSYHKYSYVFLHTKKFNSQYIPTAYVGKIRPKVKVHKCKICEKVFSKACNKNRHYMKVHYEEKYECKNCNKLFGRADSLQVHI